MNHIIILLLYPLPYLTVAILFILLLLSDITTLPIVANWIPYISFVRWTYMALMINNFQGQTFACGGANPCIKTGK